eukprot:m.45484 g.45484  ORF g.45484 m.45484 type:complete len:596 (+) comp11017_c0_seq1:93-1880(+)
MESPWSACTCGHGVHQDYREALELSCVHPALLRTSTLNARLSFLDKLPFAPIEREELLKKVFCVAFEKESITATEHFEIPALDVSGALFRDCLRCFTHFTWEAAYLDKAFHYFLSQAGSRDSLLIFVGLLCRGARECDGRRRTSFCTIINAVPSALTTPQALTRDSSASTEEEVALARGALVQTTAGSAAMPAAEATTTSAAVAAARAQLLHACTEAIDDAKDGSFKRTFVEPTDMYARAVGDQNTLIDWDVHGAPNYLALLLASVGVRLRRMPLLNDMVIGTADPIAAGLLPAVAHLWGLPALAADHPALHPDPLEHSDHGKHGESPSHLRRLQARLMRLSARAELSASAAALPPPVLGKPFNEQVERNVFQARVAALVAAPAPAPGARVGTHIEATLAALDPEVKRKGRIKSRFVWQGSNSTSFGNACIADGPANKNNRLYFAAYLQHFFLPLSAARLLPVLATLVTSNDDLLAAAQVLFADMRDRDAAATAEAVPAEEGRVVCGDASQTATRGPHDGIPSVPRLATAAASSSTTTTTRSDATPIPRDCDDVRAFLYHPIDYSLQLNAARRFFAEVGVVMATDSDRARLCPHP